MTAVAVPFAEQQEFPPCPIPGCRGITGTEGHPCPDCIERFGEYLTHNPGGRSMTSEQVRQHKADTLYAYRQMLTPAPVEPERKQNQTCWICEERHTCTRLPDGWECDTCREVTG